MSVCLFFVPACKSAALAVPPSTEAKHLDVEAKHLDVEAKHLHAEAKHLQG